MKREKILWIDSFRGIACMIVVAAHIISTHPVFGKYANGCGKTGVWCFMVLSAYLLYTSGCDEAKTFGWHELKKFYIKRVLRIYPTYFIALICSYLMGFFSTADEILYHLLAVQGKSHFWYMPVIIKFYLIMPAFLWLKNKLTVMDNLIITGVILIVFFILYPPDRYIENSMELGWYLPVFLMGMLVAIIIAGCRKYCYKNSAWYDAGVIVCSVAGIAFTPYVRERLWGIPPSSWLQNKYFLYGTLWSIIIICISFSKCIQKLLTRTTLLASLGEISLGMYLFHYPVMGLWYSKGHVVNRNGILTVIVSMGIAVIVNIFLEKILFKLVVSNRV